MTHMEFETNKTDLAYERIKELVVNLHVRPGAQLQITELSEHLAVSVTPVREALTRLHAEGLVVMVAKRGFFSRAIDVDDLRDLYELAFLILKHSIKRGIRSADKDGLADAFNFDSSNTLPSVSSQETHAKLCAEMIERLYETIARLSKNAVMIETIMSFNDKSHFIRLADVNVEDNLRMISRDMSELVELLATGDALGAITNLRRQLEAKLVRLPVLARDCVASAYLSQMSRNEPVRSSPKRMGFG